MDQTAYFTPNTSFHSDEEGTLMTQPKPRSPVLQTLSSQNLGLSPVSAPDVRAFLSPTVRSSESDHGPSIISANINGLVSKQEKLLTVLHSERILAAALQETKTSAKTDKALIRLDGFDIFGYDRVGKSGGGVAILVATHWNGHPVTATPTYPAPPGLEGRAVRIRIPSMGLDMTLATIYRPPGLNAESSAEVEENLGDWLARLGEDGKSLVLTGDFNIDRGTSKALSMESLLAGLDLHFVSPHVPTHQKSCIDWILCNTGWESAEVELLPPLEKADDGHRTLLYTLPKALYNLRLGSSIKAPAKEILIWRKLDERKAKELWSTRSIQFSLSNQSADPEAILSSISDQLWRIAEETVPKARLREIGQDQPPWYTQECAETFYAQKRAHTRHQRLRRGNAPPRILNNAYAFYKDQRRRWKAATVRATFTFIQSAVAEAKAKHRLWELYSVLTGKAKARLAIRMLQMPDNEIITEPKEMAEALKESFRGNFGTEVKEELQETTAQLKDPSPVPKEALLTPLRCYDILRKLHKKKAAGRDGLPASYIRTLAAELAYPIACLINQTITTQRVPPVWKSAWVAPVPKINPAIEPAHFRPISILPSLSKVFESHLRNLLHEQIQDPSLPSEQFGFQSRSGCQDALIYIQQRCMELLESSSPNKAGKVCIVAFDCQKAFDILPFATILDEMTRRGTPGWLLRLSKDWLTGRELRVRVGGEESLPLHLKSSTPQGSLTGPHFFNLAISSASRLDLGPRCYLSFYADDATMICDVSTPEGEANLTAACNAYSQHLQSLGLSLNQAKSQLLVVGFGNVASSLNGLLMVDGKEIKLVKKARILGIDFDHRLSFNSHFHRVSGAAKGALGAIARLVGRDSESLRFITCQRVTPLLLYSLSSVLPSTVASWRAVNGVARYAARLATNDYESPAEQLMEKIGLVSSSQLALESCLSFAIRCLFGGRKYGMRMEIGDPESSGRVSLRSYDDWRLEYLNPASGDLLLLAQVPNRHTRAKKLYPYVVRAIWNIFAPHLLPLLDPRLGTKARKTLPTRLVALRALLIKGVRNIPFEAMAMFEMKKILYMNGLT